LLHFGAGCKAKKKKKNNGIFTDNFSKEALAYLTFDFELNLSPSGLKI
jgi:hypothetical protein